MDDPNINAYEDSLHRIPLLNWLYERKANCERIAKTKSGSDRDGWLDDAVYFGEAIERLKRTDKLLFALTDSLLWLDRLDNSEFSYAVRPSDVKAWREAIGRTPEVK